MKSSIVAAITVDGKIAKDKDHGATWTSKEDKQFFVKITKEAGVIIMGSATYKTINRPLPGRLNIVMTRSPEKYQSQPGLLEFTDKSPKAILADLDSRGYKEAVIGGGSEIYSLFLNEGLVDDVYLTIEPVIFGQGVSIFSFAPENCELELLETSKLSGNVILNHYQIKRLS